MRIPERDDDDFLLVVNCARGRIMYRFREIGFDMSNIATFVNHSCV